MTVDPLLIFLIILVQIRIIMMLIAFRDYIYLILADYLSKKFYDKCYFIARRFKIIIKVCLFIF